VSTEARRNLLDGSLEYALIILEKCIAINLFCVFKNHKGITCIVATHDSTDALSYADQTIVLQTAPWSIKAILFLYNNPPQVCNSSLRSQRIKTITISCGR
jgi:ABC-type cobalamin/Fe3+-siderophores transport system ATPase subunit